MKRQIKKVRIRVLKSALAHSKMVSHFIPPDVATRLQGRVFNALMFFTGSAEILSGQGAVPWSLPKGSFSVFVSRAAALAQTKQLARYKTTPRRNRK